uniref:Uncharacterized protein n=1 Tax=viral metagenome TaxID=1070528 RepID=A0A6C0H523_9ZZZZ
MVFKRNIYLQIYTNQLCDKSHNANDQINILQTFPFYSYLYPYLCIQHRRTKTYDIVANHLEVYGKKENMNLLKIEITQEIGELSLNNNEYNGEISGLLTLNNFKIVEFPSQDIKDLLNKYNINYSYNYIGTID